MYISKDDTQQILRASEGKLLDIIQSFTPLHRSGAGYTTTCPRCGSEKGLVITPAKKIFKCFKCGEVTGKTAIDYLMTGRGMNYPDALQYLAQYCGIVLEEPAQKATKHYKDFCSEMLEKSGLTRTDIRATVLKENGSTALITLPTMKAGTIDRHGNIIKGDDMIISYYDLDGNPVTYTNEMLQKKEAETERNFFRVRWKFPEEHKDKNGRPSKYHTPVGASTPLYIPQKIRDLYKDKKEIHTLFIQEGEKKAEKACKHGIMSLAISGIQNFGYRGQLPEDIAKIVEACQVKEIIFLLDSDCFDISDHITCDEPIERRPLNFFYAVKNYREYLNILKNRGLYLEVYFGHVIKNERGDKGIDDLLADALKGKENSLLQDIQETINLAKDKVGKYVHLYKITTMPDSQIREIWNLQDATKFCANYKDVLEHLPEFVFQKHKWKYNENGELESAQPIESDEQFYQISNQAKVDRGEARPEYEFKYERCFNFLFNRGFGKYMRDTMRMFVHVENKIVKIVTVDDVRDFMMSFSRTFLPEGVLEMLHKGGPQYLGDFRLAQLKYAQIQFEKRQKDVEYLYWKDKFWEITSSGIKEKDYNQLHNFVWSNQKKEYTPIISTPLWNVTKTIDKEDEQSVHYHIDITNEGNKCDFLKFLENTSNFTWRKEQLINSKKVLNDDMKITPEEIVDNQHHLVAKLCAIGYMLSEYKDPSITKAVVGMDGKQSDVGDSNGRSGKSLLGELLKIATPTVYINGKIADIERDSFMWTEVTDNTRIVFIDDVKRTFDFEMLFPNITGPWACNYKGGGRATLPFSISPKLYITTNHMLTGDSDSFLDRQWAIVFSDFYNSKHKPTDDFGRRFFVEWDYEQWNLCWNMCAQCIELYHKLGVVEAPGERIALRRLRQSMGEEFLSWAEEYFSDEAHRNTDLVRKELYDNLMGSVGLGRTKFYTPANFKSKLKSYCKWKGYIFNPHKFNKYGQPLNYDKDGKAITDDKRGGCEYFVIGDADYYKKYPGNEMAEILEDAGDKLNL